MSDLSKNQQSIGTSGAHVDGGDEVRAAWMREEAKEAKG